MRMRRKSNLNARLEACSSLLLKNPESMRGKWQQTYENRTIHLELGCGKGSFIVGKSLSAPHIFHVALEKTANVLITALESAMRYELKNVIFINNVAENLASFFDNNELSRIYINFCDPWPSKRHEKRRLTGRAFLDVYKDILVPGGEIHFKTDNRDLFDFSLQELRNSSFKILDVTEDLHKDGMTGVVTEYEQRFHNMQMPIFMCVAAAGE